MSTEIAQTTVYDKSTAIEEVLKNAFHHGQAVRGIREVTKALEMNQCQMVFMASNCDEQNYKKLIEAFCKSKQIPLIAVDDREALGKLSGLCRFTKDGEARKTVKTSSVGIINYGAENSAAVAALKNLSKQ